MNNIKCFAFLALVGASTVILGGTATKEYVDRRDSTIAVAATNYTDAAVAAMGGVTRETVTNIAEYVTGNATNGLPEAIAAKYTKPSGGIPATDIAAGVIPFVPDVTLVWTNNAVKTKDGVRTIGAADVGAVAVTGGVISNGFATTYLTIGTSGTNTTEGSAMNGYTGELVIGGRAGFDSQLVELGDGGIGKVYLGGVGSLGGNGELYVGNGGFSGGSGKIVVGGVRQYLDHGSNGKGEIVVMSSDGSVGRATVTIGDADNGGVLTVGGSDVITANSTNSFAQGIVSEAMSATKSYLTQTNITELTPYGADSIVGKIHSASSPAGAAVVKSTIEYNASGTACIVTIAAGGQLAATTAGWPNGQATTAIITLGAGATIADNISLVGYGSWPVGEAFIASCVYYNSMVRVVPIQKVQ